MGGLSFCLNRRSAASGWQSFVGDATASMATIQSAVKPRRRRRLNPTPEQRAERASRLAAGRKRAPAHC